MQLQEYVQRKESGYGRRFKLKNLERDSEKREHLQAEKSNGDSS